MTFKRYFLPIAMAVLLTACGRTVTITQIDIIPEPVFQVQKEGSYTLNRRSGFGTRAELTHSEIHHELAAPCALEALTGGMVGRE